MSLHTHIAELERKHKLLDRELDSAIARPSSSDDEIAELKRKKLALKDEMLRLKPN